MKNNTVKKVILGMVFPLTVLAAWFYVTTYGSIPSGILPNISKVGKAFQTMVSTGQLQEDLMISISRVLKGYAFSAFFGILLGSLMGMSKNIKMLFQPVVTIIRQIPMIAWIPLIILYYGVGLVKCQK